MKPRGSLPCS